MDSFVVHHVCLYYAILSVLRSFVITRWEKIKLLAFKMWDVTLCFLAISHIVSQNSCCT